jgi:hypothetical protein
VVRDASGQALAYLYARSTESEAVEAKQSTFDEARRIASRDCRSYSESEGGLTADRMSAFGAKADRIEIPQCKSLRSPMVCYRLGLAD